MPNLEYDVIICTYNGSKYIEEQLASILAQNIKPKCVYIGDDRSTDHTIDICDYLLGKSGVRYKITKNKTNLGYAENFMKQARLCTAPVIFFCDQDDVWRKDKVTFFKEYLDSEDKGLLFFSNAYLTDERLLVKKHSLWDVMPIPKKNRIRYCDGLDKTYFITGATMAIRKRLLDRCPDIPNGVPHDAWLGVLASIKGFIVPIPEKLIFYRQHSNNQLGATKKDLKEKLMGVFGVERRNERQRLIELRISIIQQLRISSFIREQDAYNHIKFLDHVHQTLGRRFVKKLTLIFYYPKYKTYDNGFRALIADLLL